MKLHYPASKLMLGLWVQATLLTIVSGETILSDSCDSLGGFTTTGDVSIISTSACGVGNCFRMDGDGSSAGSITTGTIDTTGFTSVTLSFRAQSSSLESGEGCQALVSSDGGSTWSSIFTHIGGSELDWTIVTHSDPSNLDNNPALKFRYGTTVTSGADYCWFDDLLVVGTSGATPEPTTSKPTTVEPTTVFPVLSPTAAPSITSLSPPSTAPTGSAPSSCPSCQPPSNYDPLTGTGAVLRSELSASVLNTGTGAPSALLSWQHMEVPANAAMPIESFEGTFALPNVATEDSNFVKIKDSFNYDSDPERLHLPPVSFDLVSHGSHLIPAVRGTETSTHPFWEFALEPGRCWSETSDDGLSRCAMPFALTQRNANCVHNGVLMFLFSNDNGGTISRAWYQIASETCLYYKFDFSALATATYSNTPVTGASSIRSAFESEVSARMTTKPLSDVATDLGGDPTKFAPDVDPVHVTAYGYVWNGIHYRQLGPTRVPGSGSFPFPDGLIMPSYSTAKTHFFSAALMAVELDFPGAVSATVGNLLPNAPSAEWSDVTLQDVADMATGNYRFSTYMRDEGSFTVEGDFFLVETNALKMEHALNYYSRKETPGTTWVYHTSDHYVGLAALQEYLRNESSDPNASILQYMINNVWTPMGGSEVLFQSRVTYDSDEIPFAGYGLFYLPDDAAKLMNLMNTDQGFIGVAKVYDTPGLLSALGSDCLVDCGLTAGNFYYKNGVWKTVPDGSCAFVPFASGYGGIAMSMFPGGGNYYYFSDNDEFSWRTPSAEALRLEGTCP